MDKAWKQYWMRASYIHLMHASKHTVSVRFFYDGDDKLTQSFTIEKEYFFRCLEQAPRHLSMDINYRAVEPIEAPHDGSEECESG
jgi:hypothetical protein